MTHSSAIPEGTNANGDAAYRAAMDYILLRLNYERVSHDSYSVEDFRLARMARLLELLGQPQATLPVVHVAGTKGKGSTSAMLASMLRAAGLRVGLFTSPHIVRFEERMTINGVEPSAEEIVSLVARIRPAVETLVEEMPPGPTYFEVTTALAWLHFQSSRCDIAVMEVGLGGRLDSTNLCNPVCCIITSISRDHMRLLGDTLPKIAAEKAGIIKPGVPVISGAEQPEVVEVISKTADRAGAPLYRLSKEIGLAVGDIDASRELPQHRATVETPWGRHNALKTPLPGAHQCRNLALAVTAFDLLNHSWRTLDSGAIARGLDSLRWPLRIEEVRRNPRVILDSAHNDASAAALCATLEPLQASRRVLIYATSRDKDAASMLKIFNRGFDEVILTRYIHNPRALPVDLLAQLAAQELSIPWSTAPDPQAAWNAALKAVDSHGLICVSGSVFLAAEMQPIAGGLE
ncbi:Folylpolyglutamate synthase [Caulifigura coniformis]|uniref:Dihydrofolate synthase/folylpolyglutamate synthase n=1 Tax=Caulifigura coniformis TaxID=2527983 RepID=A0A517SGN9_9PLAN|nr:folylpolyglutamate synthase/dihydrofolate synthase family protein [Caulifigura coniformis]QDT55292.1 Folylpolyglutamate synthase [Caulifigura coniformis]